MLVELADELARGASAHVADPEATAWARVANVLLNLDEALTRR